LSAEEMMGKHCQELFHCTVCEPSCGMLQGMAASNCPNCNRSPHTISAVR
jgi:hypothetical protein